MNRIKNCLIAFASLLVLIGGVALFTSHAGNSGTVAAGAGAPAAPPAQEVIVTNTPLPITGEVGVRGTPSVIVSNPISIDPANNIVRLDPNSTLPSHETVLAYDQTVTILPSPFSQDVGPIEVSAFKQIRVVLIGINQTLAFGVIPAIFAPGPGTDKFLLESTSTPIPGPGPGGYETRVYTPLGENLVFMVGPQNQPVTVRILVFGRDN